MTIVNRTPDHLTASDLVKVVGRDNLQYVIKFLRYRYEKLKEDGVNIPETDLVINQGKTRILRQVINELEGEV